MRLGLALRISKREWYALGGFANTRLFRKGTRKGWQYWSLV